MNLTQLVILFSHRLKCLQDKRIPRQKTRILINKLTKSPRIGQLQIIPSTSLSATETNRMQMLIVRFRHTAIIEGQFLAVLDIAEGVHADIVFPIRDGCHSAAVWVAGVGEAA